MEAHLVEAHLMEIVFGSPKALYLLWGLIPLVLVLLFARSRNQKRAAAWIDAPMQDRLMPIADKPWAAMRATLIVIAIALLVFAAARPRFGTFYEPVHRSGRDLVVLLDVSRSMLSEDVYPSRLDRAKSYIRDVLARLQGDRIGLVAFAGRATPLCPLTIDQGFFGRILESASPDDVPRGGTAIGDAIRVGLESLDGYEDRERAFLLLTDGEDQDSFPREAAALAAERGVRVFTVGIGDPGEGSRVPTVNDQGGRSFLRFDGQEVWSRLDEDTLKEVALLTGGAYVPAQTGSYDLGQIYDDHLAALQAGDLGTTKRKSYRERYQIFAGLGLLAYLLAALLRTDRRAAASHGAVRAAAGAMIAAFMLSPPEAAAQAPSTSGPQGEEQRAGTDDSAATESNAAEPTAAPEPVPDGTPVELHNQAIDLMQDGELSTAARYLEHASEESKDPRIRFAAGAVHQRSGDLALAEARYTEAASGGSTEATLLARYNLGTVATTEVKEILGDVPEDATGDTRKQALARIDDAVGHFRAVLRIDDTHEDARHNLELLRLYKKHMEDVWKRKDEEKPEPSDSPPDPIDLLQKLIKDERAIRSRTLYAESIGEVKTLDPELAGRQRAISKRIDEEIREPLVEYLDKAEEEAAQSGNDDPDTAEKAAEARASIMALLDLARDEYAHAATSLDGDRPEDAARAQRNGDQMAQSILSSLGNYIATVEWAAKMQTEVAKDVPRVTSDVSPQGTASGLLLEEMPRVGAFSEGFIEQAKAQLPGVEEQIEQMEAQVNGASAPTGATPAAPTPGAPQAPSPEELQQQLESMQGVAESMRRAIERGPEIPPLQVEASAALEERLQTLASNSDPKGDPNNDPQGDPNGTSGNNSDPGGVPSIPDKPGVLDPESDEATVKSREVAEILAYIFDPLPKDENGDGGQGENQDQNQEPPEDQEQDQDQKPPPDENQEGEDEPPEGQGDQEQPPPEGGESPPDPNRNTPEQIQELLKQALAREKEYLEMKKELARRLAAPVKVEKDW